MGFKSGRAGVIATGGGNVVGPATSTAGGFARYADTTGKLLVDSAATISNADVNAAAGIVYSKLNLALGIVNADVSATAAIAYSKLNLALGIVNADVSATAAIAYSKLASMTSANILVGSVGNVATVTAVSGAISISNTGVTAYVGVVPLAQGGTNNANAAVNGGVAYSSAAAILISAAGTSGQYLKSAGAAAPVFTSFSPPTIQKFTSGSALTYTTAANALYIRVRMVGGGGGGGGSSTNGGGGGAGGAGGNSAFGTTLLTANGGAGGSPTGSNGGNGGAASLGAAIGTAISGGSGGGGGGSGGSNAEDAGGMGAPTPFGGAGGGSSNIATAGLAAIANTGSGGGGGGYSNAAATLGYSGGGGGAGGYVDAIITAPSATYTYSVGAAGTAGTAGTSGIGGGAGGSGYIEVTEYYQ